MADMELKGERRPLGAVYGVKACGSAGELLTPVEYGMMGRREQTRERVRRFRAKMGAKATET